VRHEAADGIGEALLTRRDQRAGLPLAPLELAADLFQADAGLAVQPVHPDDDAADIGRELIQERCEERGGVWGVEVGRDSAEEKLSSDVVAGRFAGGTCG